MPYSRKPLAAALGAAFLATAVSPVVSADTNPFAANQLSGGYDLVSYDKHGEGKCGDKKAEGKCGDKKAEGKCGEGKCGEKKAEGKCGEGKCGEKKAKAEGKCGENKGK
jgi:uncharacterized low-complexity protein